MPAEDDTYLSLDRKLLLAHKAKQPLLDYKRNCNEKSQLL